MSPTALHPLLACATCVGDPNAPTTLAANAAIFLMLGVLALVLGSVVSFMIYLARRSRQSADTLPSS